MLAVINALIPVFLIIVLGMVLKHSTRFDDAAWTGFENICYFVLFPILLIKTLATAQLGGAELLRFSAALLFAVCAMSALLLLAYPLLHSRFNVSPAAFTSLLQGTTRWHGFIALSIVGLLYGDEGVTYMAVTMAVIIPPLNIINVFALARFGSAQNGLKGVLLKLAQNPFILSCGIGAALNLSGLDIPAPIYNLFDILGGGALGLSLLTVGAGLHVGHVSENRSLVTFGACLRLLGMPLMMYLGCWLFAVDGLPLTVAVIAGAVPTAASSYLLARQMGGDHRLMANLISIQVLAAVATLPAMIWLSQLGLPAFG